MTLLVYIIVSFFVFSCSLNYNDTKESISTSPEFVFRNPQFTRIEENKKKLMFTAEHIEQYSGSDAMYGKNITFTAFDNNNNKAFSGQCTLFSADNGKEIYQLFDGISIHDYDKKTDITAKNLYWNSKTETLVGTTDDEVTIQTENLTITGTGFAASGKDGEYSIQKNVSGIIFNNKTTKETPNEKQALN